MNYNEAWLDFIENVEKETGFHTFEGGMGQSGQQTIFYGLSSNFDIFAAKIELDQLQTGTIAFLIDTGDKKFYYRPTNTWY